MMTTMMIMEQRERLWMLAEEMPAEYYDDYNYSEK